MSTSRTEAVLRFLQDRYTSDHNPSFNPSDLVIGGVVATHQDAVAAMLVLSSTGQLDATAIVRCDLGHDKDTIEHFNPDVPLPPEAPCPECADEGRENFEEGGILLLFGPGPVFSAPQGGEATGKGAAASPRGGAANNSSSAMRSANSVGRWTSFWPVPRETSFQ